MYKTSSTLGIILGALTIIAVSIAPTALLVWLVVHFAVKYW